MLALNQKDTDSATDELRALLMGMRAAYSRGENAMEFARSMLGQGSNLVAATLIAYDLQSGNYVRQALADPGSKGRWCAQIARLLSPLLSSGSSIMEVGSGEATTLGGVIAELPDKPSVALGFDISWSRCAHGKRWLAQLEQEAELFVADLFHIPMMDNSVDVVYTSHSLEPNGGREYEALMELLRVARKAVVLVEPIYELAEPSAQRRMEHHGYVRGLKTVAESAGFSVTDYRLLDFCSNPLNPSGVVRIEKNQEVSPAHPAWRCPLTHTALTRSEGAFVSPETGLVYPMLAGIPLLCREHAVLASGFDALR